ncbi:hypothetical protein ACFQGT_12590 [Natrialbaceae archaeon GCM10025810]|uniref:hypothetical protein n=1 Tax=Halovalidus salilacus TaxID=3075124 RepID=UPI0036189785
MAPPASSPSSDGPATDGGADRDAVGGGTDGRGERTAGGRGEQTADGGGERDRASNGVVPGGPVTRRELLAAVGGAAAVSRIGDVDAQPTEGGATLRVRVHPGSVPPSVRFRSAADEIRGDWPEPYRAAAEAVEDALGQLADYVAEHTGFATPSVAVERGEPVSVPPAERPRSSEAVLPGPDTVLEAVRRRVDEREDAGDADSGATAHLHLCWAPLNYRLGYGVARGVIGDGADAPALAVANVGATERWDGRPITRNMAIHEVFHTFLTERAVRSVGGSRCDHDLGRAVRTDDGALRVSPMATAYAGPDRFGVGTRWHGTGCYDHDEIHRHGDSGGPDDVDDFEYATDLSDATLDAVTRTFEAGTRTFERGIGRSS